MFINNKLSHRPLICIFHQLRFSPPSPYSLSTRKAHSFLVCVSYSCTILTFNPSSQMDVQGVEFHSLKQTSLSGRNVFVLKKKKCFMSVFLQVFCLLSSMLENKIVLLEVNVAALLKCQQNSLLLSGREEGFSAVAR